MQYHVGVQSRVGTRYYFVNKENVIEDKEYGALVFDSLPEAVAWLDGARLLPGETVFFERVDQQ